MTQIKIFFNQKGVLFMIVPTFWTKLQTPLFKI